MRNINTLCLALLLSFSVSAQVDFDVATILDGPNFRSISNCVVDMNGDFLDDVVTVSRDLIAVYYQQENGEFKCRKYRMTLGNLPNWSIAAADTDANGYNDLLISDSAGASFVFSDDNGGTLAEDKKPTNFFGQRSSFADINNDGHIDAFVCNDNDQNHPYINDGTGNMTLDFDLIQTPDDVPGNYAVTWVDYDNDEDMDMYLSKCVIGALPGDPARTNLLYQNDGQGNFTEVAAQAGMDDNDQTWVSLFEDFDNDGDFDAVLFNHEERHKFMLNNGDGTFTDILPQIGVLEQVSDIREAFAADFDNNGYMDFIINEPRTMFFNNGDLTFTSKPLEFYPGAIGDLNNDGWIDNVRFNQFFINQGNGNNWFKVDLVGRTSNRNGIGARCELYGPWGKQTKELRCTQGFLGMNSLNVHFGLAQFQSIDSLVVKWPSGLKTVVDQPEINKAIIVDEGDCDNTRPELEINGSTLLCAGDSVTLSVISQGDILWNTGETTSEITVHDGGLYNATLTNSNGCSTFTKTVDIIDAEDPIEVYAPFGNQVCSGSAVLLEVDTDLPVTWNNGSNNGFVYVQDPGEYFITVDSNCPETIVSENLLVEEYLVTPPTVTDAYFNPDSVGLNLFVNVESDAEFISWWTDQNMNIGSGNQLILNSQLVFQDTTFFVQACEVVNDNLCCSERVPVNIFFTDIEERFQDLGLKIYPNPAREAFIVELEDISSEVKLKIFDIMGQNVLGKEIGLLQIRNLIQLNGQAPGHYIVQLSIGGEKVFRKIVITD